MSVAPLNAKVSAANLPLERLATNTQVSDREKIAEVSRQFEAVLLRQILGQAQKPMFKNLLVGGGGTATAIYKDMITQQMADRISQGGTFGFGKVLEKELSAPLVQKEPLELKPLNLSSAAQLNAQSKPEISESHHPAKKYITVTPQPGKRI